ncbi:BspA family leucine-rich repeat surface protein [Flagellimonas marina]|uniref:BspA family leucine-rich repeat surface protein n=1 Tax=Flagellimonas marina TaxID=1775168 RepID=A0ABV8PLP1_9FLAO
MRVKKLLVLALFALGLMISCSKDDGPSTPPNSAPVITNTTKAFTVAENINDAHVIGTVTATDADKDALTFSISANSDNLFEIANSGAISLATGKTLSFATKSSHALEITVSDGTASAKANFTITVTQVVVNNETPVIGAQSFEVAENIDDTFLIGTVQASDAENDPLAFAMVTNDNDLFEITTSGELSLADGKSLDFATAEEHTLTVGVSDGNTQAQATITITVTEAVAANEAPTMGDQSFEAAEIIADDVVIGTVTASDPENDALTFAITTNDNDLFEVTADGELSLADGMNLDEETAAQHTITVSVDDGNGNVVEAEITITVLDRYESKAEDPEWFVATFEYVGNDPHLLFLGQEPDNFTYGDFIIDWGDGNVENNPEIVFNEDLLFPQVYDDPGLYYLYHEYQTESTYTVALKGDIPYMSLNFDTIEQWGAIPWKTFRGVFYESDVELNATDAPDLSQVTDMSKAFTDSSIQVPGNIGSWDVSNVTNMESMFSQASINVNLSNWDVSNVTNMDFMFNLASDFNQNLGAWDISSVTTMSGMLSDSGLSRVNYGNTLVGWASFVQSNNGPNDITFGAFNLQYCSNLPQMQNARNYLTNTAGWSITDAGSVFCN